MLINIHKIVNVKSYSKLWSHYKFLLINISQCLHMAQILIVYDWDPHFRNHLSYWPIGWPGFASDPQLYHICHIVYLGNFLINIIMIYFK